MDIVIFILYEGFIMNDILNEEINKIQMMMGVSVQNLMEEVEIDQATSFLNQKIDENLSPQDVQDIVSCVDPNKPVEVDLSSVPNEQRKEVKEKIDLLQEKMKSASLSELLELKKQFKKVRRESKRQQNEQLMPAATFLGISMPPAAAAVATFALMGLLLFLIIRYLFPRLRGSACRRPAPWRY